jgi:hypothetical protein
LEGEDAWTLSCSLLIFGWPPESKEHCDTFADSMVFRTNTQSVMAMFEPNGNTEGRNLRIARSNSRSLHGDLNDIAVHKERIAAMGTRHRRPSPSRVFVTGLLTGREDARTEGAMRAAMRAYPDLTKVKAFWR